ncbi:hypothetical protein CBOM_07452 [Ceraceosorus bombacis]|uniref:Uncharacterized protein n=1 Tax=Ceraceosorus bombacis TaxID=401625 RepID=A0A0N7L9F3_9BASI|nr:hypothetical protein CBOM_07452 [Ceraceosorus bombacis]
MVCFALQIIRREEKVRGGEIRRASLRTTWNRVQFLNRCIACWHFLHSHRCHSSISTHARDKLRSYARRSSSSFGRIGRDKIVNAPGCGRPESLQKRGNYQDAMNKYMRLLLADTSNEVLAESLEPP